MLGQEGSVWFNKEEREVITYAIGLMPKFKGQTQARLKAAKSILEKITFANEEDPQ